MRSRILTVMNRFQSLSEDCFFLALMASSDVDQKYLGIFAKRTSTENPFLSSMLYKVLGLSVILSKKLVRARRLRKLDTTRDTKSMQLYHHIIWLSREGLVIVEQYILPMVADYGGLKVLAYKLRASFYHIFVLFHNQPSINQAAIPTFATSPKKGKDSDRGSIRSSPKLLNPFEGGPVRNPGPLPPGLTPVSVPKPSASFLLPATDYIPIASSCFIKAAELADELLPGSHPIRVSVKLEYAAYLYDCLHDGEASRKLAEQSIRQVYGSDLKLGDEMFQDSAELVLILERMRKRGLGSIGTAISTPGQVSRSASSTPRARKVSPIETGVSTIVSDPGIQTRI